MLKFNFIFGYSFLITMNLCRELDWGFKANRLVVGANVVSEHRDGALFTPERMRYRSGHFLKHFCEKSLRTPMTATWLIIVGSKGFCASRILVWNRFPLFIWIIRFVRVFCSLLIHY